MNSLERYDAGSGLSKIRGAWPGDESIEEIFDALDDKPKPSMTYTKDKHKRLRDLFEKRRQLPPKERAKAEEKDNSWYMILASERTGARLLGGDRPNPWEGASFTYTIENHRGEEITFEVSITGGTITLHDPVLDKYAYGWEAMQAFDRLCGYDLTIETLM